jgi:phosphoribosyl-ATP pyrophosphohydrolase
MSAAQKVLEEAGETALAAAADREGLAAESADLLYHLIVLQRAAGLRPDDVAAELASRLGSGYSRPGT